MAENRTPAEVTDEIAEAVRTLNYMTGAGGSVELEYLADLSQVAANLKIAVERMPQLFGQMATWLADEHVLGQAAHDSGGDASEYVAAVTDALQRASDDARSGPRLGAPGEQQPKGQVT